MKSWFPGADDCGYGLGGWFRGLESCCRGVPGERMKPLIFLPMGSWVIGGGHAAGT